MARHLLLRLCLLLLTAPGICSAASPLAGQEAFAPVFFFGESSPTLELKNESKQPAVFEVEFLDETASPLRIEEASIADDAEVSLTIPPLTASVRVMRREAGEWRGRLRFNERWTTDLVSANAPGDGCGLGLETEIEAGSRALVVIGTGGGIRFSCHSSPDAGSEEEREIPECQALGLNAGGTARHLSLRTSAQLGGERLWFYAAILNAAGLVRIVEPEQLIGFPHGNVISCDREHSPARFPLVAPEAARQAADDANKAMRAGQVATAETGAASALERFRAAVARDPASVCVRGQYISALRSAGAYEKVDIQLAQLQRLAPDHETTLFHQGLRALEKDNFGEAARIFSKLLERSPESCGVRSNLSLSLMRAARPPEEILALWRAAPTPCGKGLAIMAWCRQELGDGKEAYRLFRDAISLLNQELRTAQSSLVPGKIGSYPAVGIVNIYRELAEVYGAIGEPDRATLAIERALRLAPADVDANAIAGRLAGKVKRLDEALEYFNRAFATGVDNSALRLARGWVYQNRGDVAGALQDYAQALRFNPNEGQVYLNRGLLFLAGGQLDDAETDFRKAAQIMPRSSEPAQNLGVIASIRAGAGTTGTISYEPRNSPVITTFEQAIEIARQSDQGPTPELIDWLHHNQSLVLAKLREGGTSGRDAAFLLARAGVRIAEAARLIVPLASTSDSAASVTAIAALRVQNDPAAWPVLAEIASGKAAGCRSCALEALAALQVPESIGLPLVREIFSKPVPELLPAAAELLGSLACRAPALLNEFPVHEAAHSAFAQAKTLAIGPGCK